LAIYFVCRKCNKRYAENDYEESKFCKTCGSFLLREYRQDNDSQINLITKKLNPPKLPTSEPNTSEKDKSALKRAAESLKQRIGNIREYEIVSDLPKETESYQESPAESWIWNSEFDKALKLEKQLIRKFKDKRLEEAIPGKVTSNEHGDCYSITDACTCNFNKVNYEESRRLITSNLKIIPGIGPIRERELKQQGYNTIEALKKHPIWREQAQKFLNLLDAKEIGATQNWLWERLPKSHPLVHYTAGLCNLEDFAIIDIETLGLSERPIILLGIAKPKEKSVCISQFLLRDIQDEPSAIWALTSQLNVSSSLITFNGKSFDIPYIKQRLAYYGMDASLSNPHFDVLHFTRRALGGKLANCRLETVEKYLDIERKVDIPGAMVPHFYNTYLNTGNVGPLVAIVEHNKQDLITLGSLFSKLYEEWKLD
jgi:uncharacterized protein